MNNPLKKIFSTSINSNQFKKKNEPTIINNDKKTISENNTSLNKNKYTPSLNYLQNNRTLNDSFFSKNDDDEENDMKKYIRDSIQNEVNYQVEKKINNFKLEIGQYLNNHLSKDDSKTNDYIESLEEKIKGFDSKFKKIDESLINYKNNDNSDNSKDLKESNNNLSYIELIESQNNLEKELLCIKEKVNEINNDITLVKSNNLVLDNKLEETEKNIQELSKGSIKNISLENLEQNNKKLNEIKNDLTNEKIKINAIENNINIQKEDNKNHELIENKDIKNNIKTTNEEELSFGRGSMNFNNNLFDRDESIINKNNYNENDESQFFDKDLENFMTNNNEPIIEVSENDSYEQPKENLKLSLSDKLKNIIQKENNNNDNKNSEEINNEEENSISENLNGRKSAFENNYKEENDNNTSKLNASIIYNKEVFKKTTIGHSVIYDESVIEMDIDENNFLIDKKGFPILDDNGHPMKLNDDDIETLKENGCFLNDNN